MRNLFIFIYKYHFTFLFIIFETLSIYLVVQNNNYHKAKYINSSNSIVGYVFSKYSEATDYLKLKQINNQLAEENARLHSMLKNSATIDEKKEHTLNDTTNKKYYQYISAKVINNSINKSKNYITIV